jgi:NAD(P)-dependent dehydrogenase (short-subunit alcohol dehydrogenase family)
VQSQSKTSVTASASTGNRLSIVITGSTRGIGRGLAVEFLRRGHAVTLAGRDPAAVEAAVAALEAGAPGRVAGRATEVSDAAAMQALWDLAVERFSRVDLWINNAGMTTPKQLLTDLRDTDIATVVHSNLTGLIYGCQVAIRGMRAQPGGGRIFNMEGFGSDGLTQPGMTVYGATKCAVRYLTKSLVKECAGTPVLVCTASPGIVITEFLTRDLYAHDPAQLVARRGRLILLADRVETVAPALVDGMLKADKPGADVRWMTPMRAIGRLLAAPFRKRDPFAAPAGGAPGP